MAFLFGIQRIPRYLRRYGYALTWPRVWNAGKVAASLGLSCLLRRPVVWGRPFVLMVEPTNLCNLKCPLCPSGNGQMSRPRGRMDLERYRALIDEAGPQLLLLMLWNQGEPFLSPALLEMVRYARARRIPTLTSTNGHFVRTDEEAMAVVESGLDEIIFSLDGVEQATYERYRVGGQLERVLSAIRRVVAARDRAGVHHPSISLQFIAMRHNEDEVRAARDLAADLGVDTFLVKTAQVYSGEQADAFLPRAEGLRRYAAGPEPLVVKGQPRRGCKVLWYSSTVNWDGTVSPCCFDKDADLAMGRVGAGETLGRLWRGRAYTEFRQRLLRGRGTVAMCRNCSEGYRGMFSLVDPLSG